MADYRKNKALKGLNRSHFPSNASENVTDVTQFFTGKNYDRIRNLKLFLENGGDCAKNKDAEFLLENMEVDSSAHVDHFIEDKETGNIYRNDGKKWYKCEDGSEEFVEVDPNNDEFLKAKQKDILKAKKVMGLTRAPRLAPDEIREIIMTHIRSGSRSNTISTQSGTLIVDEGDNKFTKYVEDRKGKITKSAITTDDEGNCLTEEEPQEVDERDRENFENQKREQEGFFNKILRLLGILQRKEETGKHVQALNSARASARARPNDIGISFQ